MLREISGEVKVEKGKSTTGKHRLVLLPINRHKFGKKRFSSH